MTSLNADTGTCGDVFITARVEVFDSTIMTTLYNVVYCIDTILGIYFYLDKDLEVVYMSYPI